MDEEIDLCPACFLSKGSDYKVRRAFGHGTCSERRACVQAAQKCEKGTEIGDVDIPKTKKKTKKSK